MPKYNIFGHTLHSTLQASTCLFEVMPSHGTPYPGAPPLFLYYHKWLLMNIHDENKYCMFPISSVESECKKNTLHGNIVICVSRTPRVSNRGMNL